jgi:hypothetical protein
MSSEKINYSSGLDKSIYKEKNESEKNILWKNKRAEVETTADRLGLGVDEKIKESVVAFMAHGFTTSASCEGHLVEPGKREHGLPFPWVDIYAPEPEGWRDSQGDKQESLNQEWRVKNFEQQKKMMKFFEEFYTNRETPFDARLSFRNIGIYGGFRVQSFGAEMTSILTPEEKKEKLNLYQEEMKDFTLFLKNKFLS